MELTADTQHDKRTALHTYKHTQTHTQSHIITVASVSIDVVIFPFSAMTLLVREQERHPACKTLQLQDVQSSSQIVSINKPTSSVLQADALPVAQETVSKEMINLYLLHIITLRASKLWRSVL